jgi:site-specific DNA-methyltransferase (adenine-specific)
MMMKHCTKQHGGVALTIPLDKLHLGDCIKLLNKVDEASIDLAFADPPFNIGYKYDVYKDKKSADEYLDWTRQWTAAVSRVLKPDGTFWIAIGDEFAAEIKMIVQHDLGLICRSWVIWYYTFGVNCKKKFSRSHVHLFHFVKDPKQYTFNGADISVPSARQLVYGDSRANPDGRLPDDTWILRPHDVPDGFSPDGDTWFYPRVNGTFKERAGWHGCQMPEQVLGRIIKVSSNPGDTVLDPFAGSATTLAVAKKLNRQWLGFELSEDYYKNGAKRLKSIQHGDSLEGPENPLYSVPNTANGRRLADKNGTPKKTQKKKSPKAPDADTAPLLPYS